MQDTTVTPTASEPPHSDEQSEPVDITIKIIAITVYVLAGAAISAIAAAAWENRKGLAHILRNSLWMLLVMLTVWMALWLQAVRMGGAR